MFINKSVRQIYYSLFYIYRNWGSTSLNDSMSQLENIGCLNPSSFLWLHHTKNVGHLHQAHKLQFSSLIHILKRAPHPSMSEKSMPSFTLQQSGRDRQRCSFCHDFFVTFHFPQCLLSHIYSGEVVLKCFFFWNG